MQQINVIIIVGYMIYKNNKIILRTFEIIIKNFIINNKYRLSYVNDDDLIYILGFV